MEDIYKKISNLFQSIEKSVLAANRLAKAYAEGTGNPDWYTPFDQTEPQKVAMNLAGLYAADTAANVIAIMRAKQLKIKLDEKDYLNALKDIANNNLLPTETFVVQNLANLSWRAGQPFGDLAEDPLGKIKRGVNTQFNLLNWEEKQKDLIQVHEGAKILLEEIKS